MHIVFFSTSDVFKAEEILNEKNIECKVVPTPVQDKAYCGVCLELKNRLEGSFFGEIEFNIIQ